MIRQPLSIEYLLVFAVSGLVAGCKRDHVPVTSKHDDSLVTRTASKHRSTDDSGWDYGERHIFWQIKQDPDSILPLNLPKDSIPDSRGITGLYDRYEKQVQAVMDSVYAVILEHYKNNPESLRYLKRAQAEWVKYRDAEMNAIINPSMHGSWDAVRECYVEYSLSLMRERIAEMLMWTSLPKEVATGQNICNTFGSDSRNADTIVFSK